MSTIHAEAPAGAGRSALSISTVAGTGVAWFAGDDGPAVDAELSGAYDVMVDGTGVLHISDRDNHRIRKVTPDGTISTVVGSGTAGPEGDGGPAVSAQLNSPRGIASDSAGALYIADSSNHRVRKVTPDGTISTVAGTGTRGSDGDGGPATAARLNRPFGVVVDADGVLYIADQGNHRVRKVTPDGKISTFAGTGAGGFSGDGGPATSSRLQAPMGLALDGSGTLYIADTHNHRVRKVTADGCISTVAGTGTGTGTGGDGDGGPATAAQLRGPMALTLDSTGTLYIADTSNHRIRKVTPDGTISAVAGTGTTGMGGDGGPAASAQLSSPTGLALDSADALYVCDLFNNRVRKIGPAKAELPESGTVVSWANVRSKLWMGVQRESTKDGAEIHQSLASRREHQRWRLNVAGQGDGHPVYTLENVRSGKVLEVVRGQGKAGTVAVQRAYEGDDAHHQQWSLVPVDRASDSERLYRIVNRWCGLPLSVGTSPRTALRVHEDEGDDRNRHWQLLPV
ncbi:RICIN domain-containing protein [Streptomyces albidoflavus]